MYLKEHQLIKQSFFISAGSELFALLLQKPRSTVLKNVLLCYFIFPSKDERTLIFKARLFVKHQFHTQNFAS